MSKAQTRNHAAEKERAAKVLAHPAFRSMAKQKAWLGWGFSAAIFAVYVAFIWTIGTAPQVLAAKESQRGNHLGHLDRDAGDCVFVCDYADLCLAGQRQI